jgi:hypothetical protein
MDDGVPTRLTPAAFVAKWSPVTLKERSAAQEHFIDLCQLVGHPTPAAADPTGMSFGFEARASRVIGRSGWVDVWKQGYFAWEYKGKHGNLYSAYCRLLEYREALHNPPLLIVCDIERIIIHTNFTNTLTHVYTLAFADLLTPTGLERLWSVFFDPYALCPDHTHPVLHTVHATPPRFITQPTGAAAQAFQQVVLLFQEASVDECSDLIWFVRRLNGEPVAFRKPGTSYWRIPTGSRHFKQRVGKSAVQRYGQIWLERGWVLADVRGKPSATRGIPNNDTAVTIAVPETVLL